MAVGFRRLTMILADPPATVLAWLLNGILDRRLELETVTPSLLRSRWARLLKSDATMQGNWARFIAEYRKVLLNPDEAPGKVAMDLAVVAPDFDGELADTLAELLACTTLR